MDLVKWVLVFIVLCIILTQIKPVIETFYPQVSGLPFQQENKLVRKSTACFERR